MNNIDKCPICGRSELKTLKRHMFYSPEAGNDSEKGVKTTYQRERLQVFFDHIWKGGNEAELCIDLCRSCGLIFINPRFTKEEIRTKYRVLEESISRENRKGVRPWCQERASRIHGLISGLSNKPVEYCRILDYGGAEGYNLVPFIRDNSCFVLDYIRHDTPVGIVYLGSDLDDLDPDDRFDVVLLCHTLEHVVDPMGIITDLSSYLAEDGLIYIEVPLGVSHEWRGLREPLTHINFFSEESSYNCVRMSGLDAIHLSTEYQWSVAGKSWCINMVGSRGRSGSAETLRYKSTRRQMRGLRYYYPLLEKKALGIIGKDE